MMSATRVDVTPIISDTRVPCAMPAAMSRPRLSLPSSMPSVCGGVNGAATVSQGSPGKNKGALAASTITASRITRPSMPLGWRRKDLRVCFIGVLCAAQAAWMRGSITRYSRSVTQLKKITSTDSTRNTPSITW